MVTVKDIEYAGDGSTMIGRLALPAGDDERPAVLIAHEGGGLDEYQKGRAERFADLGYVSFALDYHGGGKPVASEAEMRARCQALWDEPARIGGTEHSFTNPASESTGLPGLRYHQLSDERSWRAMLDLLDEVFRRAHRR